MRRFDFYSLLNLAPRIKTKVYVKPTNTCLLLHYQSHVDNRYKWSLITTMLDRAYRISSDRSYFSQECDRLETVFLKLKYPRHLFNLAVKHFVDSKVADQQQIPERLGRASWRKATRCEEQPQEGKTSVILNQNYD